MVSCAISLYRNVKNHKAINLIQIIDIVNDISNKIPTRLFSYNAIYIFLIIFSLVWIQKHKD